jgi:hypothetical protein
LGRFFETNYKKSGILNAAFFIVIAWLFFVSSFHPKWVWAK